MIGVLVIIGVLVTIDGINSWNEISAYCDPCGTGHDDRFPNEMPRPEMA